MTFKIVRVSSKGQLVIPLDIRKKLNISEGDTFFVLPLSEDVLLLKKIIFDDEDYKTFNKELVEALKELGVEIDEKVLEKAFKKIIDKYASSY